MTMKFTPAFRFLVLFGFALFAASLHAGDARWLSSWSTTVMPEPAEKHDLPLADATLRQVVHVSLGGDEVRIRFSNAFGRTPVSIRAASVALAGAQGTLAGPAAKLSFGGREFATIPVGASLVSDPVKLAVPSQTSLAISIQLGGAIPPTLSYHGGSRTTSYLQPGNAVLAETLPEAKRFVGWIFIAGVDVRRTDAEAATLIVMGDSISDGYGTTTDRNERWPDELLRRWNAEGNRAPLGLANVSLGGNRLLRDGLGPNVLARFERDVLTQAGAKWLLLAVGINDIGTRVDARKNGHDYATADDLIAGYRQIIARAKAHGLRVYGATMTPYTGADFYWSEDGEADRQAVNAWIRESGEFDAVVDFDAAVRDPAKPERLAAEYDCGDHLHPSIAGYKRMAEAVDLALFAR